MADAIEVAAGHDPTLPFGRGAVIEGICGHDMLRGLEKTFCSFVEAGFAGGAFIIQSLSMADDKNFDLVKYDEIAVKVLGEPRARPRVLTAYTGACASAVIVIAFRKPRPDLATDP